MTATMPSPPRRLLLACVALLAAVPATHAKPLYFAGNAGPTIWVGDTGGAGVAPASVLYSGVGNGAVGIDESDGQLFWGTARGASVMTAPAGGGGTPSVLGNSQVAGSIVQLDVAVDRASNRYFFTVTQGTGGVPGLYWANLDGASLDGASLDGASLDGASLDGGGEPTLIDGAVGPTAVLYDPDDDYLYYANNSNTIRRVRPDGSGQEDLIVSDTHTFCDIAADFAAGKLYYTESLAAIGVLDLDTLSMTTLFDPPGTVRSVDLDLSTQTLYWAAFGVNANNDDAVQSGAADGSGPITTLYQGDLHDLRGLAVGGTLAPEPSSGLLLLIATAAATRSRRR